MSAKSAGDIPEQETLSEVEGLRMAALPGVVAPHLFVLLECSRPSAGGARHSLANIERVTIGRGPKRSSQRVVDGGVPTLSLRVPDLRVSTGHAHIVRDGRDFLLEDLGSRNGTRVNGRYLKGSAPLRDCDLIEVGHTILAYRAAVTGPRTAPADVESLEHPDAPLTTLDPELAHRAAMLARVARSESPVLLLGETGTGKEVLAQAVHRLSGRSGPMVAVNCGGLTATLAEAQLFGHVRGAFSGAVADSPGLLRSAAGGTLFLDEIGDLPLPSQAALLRALQEHEVVPVGGTKAIKVDFRVVAATHRHLQKLVALEQFRGDLFARIAAFVFELPPVRARWEDIGSMVAAFVANRPVQFTRAAGRALFRYEWPLNVRELRQVLDVAGALAGQEPIDLIHLPRSVSAAASDTFAPPADSGDPLRDRLVDSLQRHRGNISEVAREFGKARMQVQRWMRRFGLSPRSFRSM